MFSVHLLGQYQCIMCNLYQSVQLLWLKTLADMDRESLTPPDNMHRFIETPPDVPSPGQGANFVCSVQQSAAAITHADT